MITQTKYSEVTKGFTIEKSTSKIWAQDLLMDMISTYNYRLEEGREGTDKMTEKELAQCMEQLKKQADRIAKLFGFTKHWTT